MKLLFGIKSLHSAGGGAERVLADVANGLAARGHEIAVLTLDSPGRSFYQLDRCVIRYNLGVVSPGHPTPRSRLLAALARMRRIVREARPDLVVGFMHSMYIPLGISLIGSGIPVVASEHAPAAHFARRPVQRAMVTCGSSLFVAKTVPTEGVRREYGIIGQKRIVVIPNPVDLRAFKNLSSRKPRSPPTILSLGRLSEEKNHLQLLAAFDLLTPAFPQWRLRIVGDGLLRDALEREIRKQRFPECVELAGATRDVRAEYERARIVAVPSLYESFGMVALEALAAGRPVVAFNNCHGTRDLIRNGENGLLVSGEGNRIANLASGLRILMENESFCAQLGAAGPDSVKSFALEGILDSWERSFSAWRVA